MSLLALARDRLAKLAAAETAGETALKQGWARSGDEPCFTVSPLGPETVKRPLASAAVRGLAAAAGAVGETAGETALKQGALADLPPDWREGLARLWAMFGPPGWPWWRDWERVRADALALAPWAAQAAALGWGALDLWGCNPDPAARRLDRDGLAMLLDGGELLGIEATAAPFRTPGGSVLRYYRRDLAGAVPLWELS